MLPLNIYFTFQRFIWIRDGNNITSHEKILRKKFNQKADLKKYNTPVLFIDFSYTRANEGEKIRRFVDYRYCVQNKLNFHIFKKFECFIDYVKKS